ncbi:uncharacterized protein LOC133896404 [Phragmites australis]|uniref:uncharacterized protein LOC133896404 n=1 Tax=Phragmites australis TaxID=29695 RepID=UPI002D77B000|nr:uncharacterized protein LOC133896404 [Phragmites australis]
MKERLRWTEQGVDVSFEGRIDVGSSNGPRIKMKPPIGYDSEWKAYVKIVMDSKVRVMDLIVRKLVRDPALTAMLSNLNISSLRDGLEEVAPSQQCEVEVTLTSQESIFDCHRTVADVDKVPQVVPDVAEVSDAPIADDVAHMLPNDLVGVSIATDQVDVDVLVTTRHTRMRELYTWMTTDRWCNCPLGRLKP